MPKRLLLNRNEVIQGPSPQVMRAIRRFSPQKASFYFDGYYGSALAPFLAKRFGLPEARVSVGYGIEFFLRTALDSLSPATDTVLTHKHHYTYLDHYARAKNLRLTIFGMIDQGDRFTFDIEDCLAKIRAHRPKMIVIASPNNPTGNTIAAADLETILKAAGKRTIVMLDEAYWGFDPDHDETKTLALLKRHSNLVVVRGFSKAYALAGLRIGFALWGSGAKRLLRYDDLYLGGSRILEEAALAALKDISYYRALRRSIIADRTFFTKEVNVLKNFRAYHSVANFVLVKVAPKAKARANTALANAPIVIAKFVTPVFMRVTIGGHANTERFLKTLRAIDKTL